jgi:hypothetical protein
VLKFVLAVAAKRLISRAACNASGESSRKSLVRARPMKDVAAEFLAGEFDGLAVRVYLDPLGQLVELVFAEAGKCFKWTGLLHNVVSFVVRSGGEIFLRTGGTARDRVKCPMINALMTKQ